MKSNFIRIAGLAAVLGGLYLLIIFIVGELSSIDEGIIWSAAPVMPLLLLLGTAGLYALAGKHNGVQAGLIVIALGNLAMAAGFSMMVWLENEYGWGVMAVGMYLQPAGFLLLGFANRRAQILPRLNWLPLVMGVLIGLGALFGLLEEALGIPWQQQNDYEFYLFVTALGVGWILLGGLMWGTRRTTAVSAIPVSLFLLAFLLVSCSSTAAAPKVSFQTPADGATVSSPVPVVMQAENFTVEAAGEVHNGAGHLHIIIDAECVTPGSAIPKDETHLHFGDGSTSTEVELASGTHTLCLQAADGAHVALDGKGMTHEITVTVP